MHEKEVIIMKSFSSPTVTSDGEPVACPGNPKGQHYPWSVSGPGLPARQGKGLYLFAVLQCDLSSSTGCNSGCHKADIKLLESVYRRATKSLQGNTG